MSKNQKQYKEEEEGIRTEELNWFYRIITLGDRFSWKDFYDRLKKAILNFLIVFFGVLVSFGVEQKGAESDDRESNIENLIGLRDELKQLINEVNNSDMVISSEVRSEKDMTSKGMIIESEGNIINLIEKPKIEQVCSKFAISGRYILSSKIFEKLEKLESSERGEIELTDALNQLLKDGKKIKHKLISGKRLDVGTPDEYLRANIAYAKSKGVYNEK